MPRYLVVIPELREEIIDVEYEIEAGSIREVENLIGENEFFDKAEYLESRDSQWGFEVKEYFYDRTQVEELKDGH